MGSLLVGNSGPASSVFRKELKNTDLWLTLKMGSLDILSLIRGNRPRKTATHLLQDNEPGPLSAGLRSSHTDQMRSRSTIAAATDDIHRLSIH